MDSNANNASVTATDNTKFSYILDVTSLDITSLEELHFAVLDELAALAVAEGGSAEEHPVFGPIALCGDKWQVTLPTPDRQRGILTVLLKSELFEAIGTPLLHELARLLPRPTGA